MKRELSKAAFLVIVIVMICIPLVYYRGGGIFLSSQSDEKYEKITIPENVPDNVRNAFACKTTAIPLQYEISRYHPIVRKFSSVEEGEVSKCRTRDLKKEHKNSWDTFFTNKVEYIRWNNHTYLNQDSTVIEVGGNVGTFSDHLQQLFKPRRYIILEPMEAFFKTLQGKYQKRKNIVVLNFGLAKEDRVDWVRVDGGSTSRFLPANVQKNRLAPLRQVNATNFFLSMSVGFYEIDLLTINCEGCEYDVIASVVDSNLVHYFRHIQISFHHMKGLGDTLKSWCEYQQILSRTHRLVYQYPMFWESWTRKDLKQ